MPIHVSDLSRRRFLLHGSAGAAGLAFLSGARDAVAADRVADPNLFAWLSDTHIPESDQIEARGVNMTANLRQVVGELRSLETRPSGVLINGDCAYLKGLPGDYANLAACLAPLAEAGFPLHLTMGNHDDRGPLYDALSDQRPDDPPIESKHVSLIESPHANLFLLDSLREVNVVTGELGQQQLRWLAAALDAHADKPAVIIAHHNPQFEPPAANRPWSGMLDTDDLFEVLTSRDHVKAVVFGHTHRWTVGEHQGIHLINLPPVAYVFADAMPNGWVSARMRPDGIDLELRTIDANHSRSGERVTLAWR